MRQDAVKTKWQHTTMGSYNGSMSWSVQLPKTFTSSTSRHTPLHKTPPLIPLYFSPPWACPKDPSLPQSCISMWPRGSWQSHTVGRSHVCSTPLPPSLLLPPPLPLYCTNAHHFPPPSLQRYGFNGSTSSIPKCLQSSICISDLTNCFTLLLMLYSLHTNPYCNTNMLYNIAYSPLPIASPCYLCFTHCILILFQRP